LFRRAADHVDEILKGANPPICLSCSLRNSRWHLKAAKALGLTIPPTLLARADEVIE
jgi:putative ABC transport system substrate-binding protein